jgi:hypothetical protein
MNENNLQYKGKSNILKTNVRKLNSFLLYNFQFVKDGYWTKAEGDISSHAVLNASRRCNLGGFRGKSYILV